MGKFYSRNYIVGDEQNIVSLYNSVTGRDRSVQQHMWEWLDSPLAPSDIHVVINADSGELVAHHGLIHIKVYYNDSLLSAGKTENTILHHSLQGTGIYFIYERKFHKQSKERFDFAFTTAGHGTQAKIRKKLGYEVVSNYASYLKISNRKHFHRITKYFINKKNIPKVIRPFFSLGLHIALHVSLVYFYRKKRKPSGNIHFQVVKEYDQGFAVQIDDFWETNKNKLGITMNRDSKYLKWRIFDNPNILYSFIAAFDDKRLIGYVITAKSSRTSLNSGRVVDIVAQDNDFNLFSKLIRQAEKSLNRQGVSIISFPTINSGGLLAKHIEKAGFSQKPLSLLSRFKKQKNVEFLVDVFSSKIEKDIFLNPDNWYYTDLFSEGYE
jgi:hypothetical protein